MSYKSGSDFEDHYNGSTSAITGETVGSDGETRVSSGWHKTGETSFKTLSNGSELISKQDSKNGRQNDHIHYYNNTESGERECKVTKPGYDAETGSTFKDKSCNDDHLASNLFEGVKNFLGF